MANVKISDLASAASVTGTQQFEVNDSGTSKKVTGAQILSYVESEISSSPTLTGQVSFDDGSATAPSITNTGDTNTGIYFSNPDELVIVTGGVDRVSVNSSGNLVTSGNIELGHVTDTTISRVSAGVIAVEGQTLATESYVTSSVSSAIPTGSVMPFAGTTEPSGWLLCFGQEVSRTTYASLFAIISTTYGVGNGSTTFNLPDLRGRVVAGQDDMGGTSANRLTNQSGGLDGDVLGATGGAETHTLTIAQMPAHTHTVANTLIPGSIGTLSNTSLVRQISNTTSGSTGGGGAHNNVQPTIILNYIIKV